MTNTFPGNTVSCETFHKNINLVLNPYSIFVDIESAEKLISFWNFFCHWNKAHNLSSVTDLEEATFIHFADSLFPASEKNIFSQGKRVLDLGTGGGFPGIPLSMLFKDCQFFLLDKCRKKTSFLSFAAADLDLKNVFTVNSKLEDYKSSKYDIITSRAVRIDKKMFDLCRNALNEDGWLVVFYSHNQIPFESDFLDHVVEYELTDRKRVVAYYHF
ncbi:MAG TPA: 16S rRNA (guanine(527)-N(7))-methyltransferase RsmG [bacterium]|nr:16S rRNA (guanine(527)-N(7))-methyltransferase RsmG [bacterium]